MEKKADPMLVACTQSLETKTELPDCCLSHPTTASPIHWTRARTPICCCHHSGC